MSPFNSFMTVSEISDRLVNGRLSSVDLIEHCLSSIASRDAQLHSFVEVYADDARLAAQSADLAMRSGHRIGPLHGVPIGIKDLVEIEGRITTGGCAAWRARRSDVTATIVQRLIREGAIILGKTHTVEFASGGWGTNRLMGTPYNPWDPKVARTPGGSSSGSGVAVAAGLVPWAIGTDTGGSVRLPASWCNLTALKVSTGRISAYGILPLSYTLDTPGPMARSVDDVALLYSVLQGYDVLDRRTYAVPAGCAAASNPRGVRGLRLAVIPEPERDAVDREVLAAYDESIDVLRQAGAQIVQIALPYGYAEVGALNGLIMSAEGYAVNAELLDDSAQPLDEDVRPRLLSGRDISAGAYIRSLRQREAMQHDMDSVFGGIDAVLTPTTTTPALKLEDVDQSKSAAHFTRFANFFNLPALALPNGATDQGLPTSLQIIGRTHNEALVLDIGRVYQKLTEWHRRTPPAA